MNRRTARLWAWRTARLCAFGLFVLAVYTAEPWRALPAEWNPWAPLSVDHPLTPITQWKLQNLNGDRQACLDALSTAAPDSLDYSPLDDYTPVAGCPLTNVVRVRQTGVTFNAPVTLSCPLAVRWIMFERQQLQSLALGHLGARVKGVEHFGSFACRNVYHRAEGRRSQHATASAFDVAGFTLQDGSKVSVLRDWDNPASPERGAFLREVHSAACGYFGTVLGPDYNQPHENHFHFDTSNWGFCR